MKDGQRDEPRSCLGMTEWVSRPRAKGAGWTRVLCPGTACDCTQPALLAPGLCICLTYSWPLSYFLLSYAFCVTYYWFLNSALLLIPELCYYWSLTSLLPLIPGHFITTDPWILGYIVLTSELCLTYFCPSTVHCMLLTLNYYWHLHSKPLLIPDQSMVRLQGAKAQYHKP